MRIPIEIPADNDGYVLQQCPLCGEYFKIQVSDFEDDCVLEICCPCCGLVSDSYFTEDVIEHAEVLVKNYAMELMFNEMKKWEHTINNGVVSFKAGKKPKEEYVTPIHTTIEALTIHQFQCCGRKIKLKPLLLIASSYCPFCGVKEFEAKQN